MQAKHAHGGIKEISTNEGELFDRLISISMQLPLSSEAQSSQVQPQPNPKHANKLSELALVKITGCESVSMRSCEMGDGINLTYAMASVIEEFLVKSDPSDTKV